MNERSIGITESSILGTCPLGDSCERWSIDVHKLLLGRYWQFEADRSEEVGEVSSGFPDVQGELLSALNRC